MKLKWYNETFATKGQYYWSSNGNFRVTWIPEDFKVYLPHVDGKLLISSREFSRMNASSAAREKKKGVVVVVLQIEVCWQEVIDNLTRKAMISQGR